MAVTPVQLAVGAVLVLRLIELWISRRNAEARIADGAEEVSGDLHLAMAMFHAGWLVALAFLSDGLTTLDPLWLAAAIILLGWRATRLARARAVWTWRLFRSTPPAGADALPRVLWDPAYAPMLAELLAIPMIFGLGWFALAGAAIYAVLAWQRLEAEGLR